MKKHILYLLIIVLSSLIILQVYLLLQVNINTKNNKLVLKKIYNEKATNIDKGNIKLPIIEFNNKNYIGIINLNNLVLPIESACNHSIFKLQAACHYKTNPLIIMATSFNDSIKNYDQLSINNNITFTNNLGISYQYEITEIKRLNKLTLNFQDDLIIIIRNYFEGNYIIIKGSYI